MSLLDSALLELPAAVAIDIMRRCVAVGLWDIEAKNRLPVVVEGEETATFRSSEEVAAAQVSMSATELPAREAPEVAADGGLFERDSYIITPRTEPSLPEQPLNATMNSC